MRPTRPASTQLGNLLSFRFCVESKTLKLVCQRRPATRYAQQQARSAGRILQISPENFVLCGIRSALFDRRHIGVLSQGPWLGSDEGNITTGL